MTVGRRVALLVSLSVALSVIAMGVAAYITTRITLFNKLDSQLTRIASTVSGPIQVDMKNLDGVGSPLGRRHRRGHRQPGTGRQLHHSRVRNQPDRRHRTQ